ncbi:Protein VACUOLELESS GAMETOPHYTES [Cardamine amara subsp. amara]|uniref:Protein VACUOLELESS GAMETOPHYTES n=1 Tax=Cardamine amara subsp. amara TaxID=228776 RepID=A0ABD1BWQ2_CARAN
MDSVKLQPTHEHPLTLVAGQAECKACKLHTKTDHYYRCTTCQPGTKSGSFHKECITHYSEITHPYHPIHPLQFCTREYGHANTCFWCKKEMGYAFYRCSICNLNIHLFCASQGQLVLTLDPGKDHHHPLTIFPRRMHFTCNFCASVGEWFPIYACVQCDLMVHPYCLGLP